MAKGGHIVSIRQYLAAAISAFSQACTKFLAPALPWIFLGLRRALIPSACWVILAIFFFVVPQSREVLHGLSEPPLKSIYDFNERTFQLVNIWSLSSYVVMSTILALGLWYSARLLVTVEAGEATPSAMTTGSGPADLNLATTWLPRILGVSTLAATLGAMIYANYTPQLVHLGALAIVGLGIGGPLLVAVGYLTRTQLGGTWPKILLGIGIVVFLAGAVFLALNTLKWRVWVWSTVSSVLPALLLVFLVKRRSLVERFGMSPAGASHTARPFGDVLVTVLAILIGSVVALLLLALSPPVVVRGFGSAAAVLMFLGAAALLLTALQLVLRHLARNVPGLTTAAVLVVAILVAEFGAESVGTETLRVHASDQAPPPALPVTAAPVTTTQAPAPRPVYVNAYGGGLRAAAFTAEVLAQADDATCGRFGEQVSAFSGVSGGSLGIATYLVARQELKARDGWAKCEVAAAQPKTPLTDIVTRALVQDHLSPAIARMLAVDAPHIYGSPSRGQALLDSWQSALVSSLEEEHPQNARKPAALALRLRDLTGGMIPPARAYFNSTNADSGHIVWFSNRDNGLVGDNIGYTVAAGDMSVGEAVLHSARFPIVSPAGWLDLDPAGRPPMRLIDGGYADNSGTITLLDELRVHPQPSTSAGKVLLIDIDGNPPDESFCVTTHGKSPILTSVRGLLQARSAHATLAVQQFRERVDKTLVVQLNLEEVYGVKSKDARDSLACQKVLRAQQAPLGWYVSYSAAQSIAKSASLGVEHISEAIGMSPQQATKPVRVEQ